MMSSTHHEQKTEIETLYVEDSDLTFFVPDGFTGVVVYTDPRWSNGDEQHWYLNGKRHREDGPAIIEASGLKHWYLNGECHREDGPAVEWPDGPKTWFLNGECLFWWSPESQSFLLLEEFIDDEGKEQIKVLTQEGIRIWPNLPGLKECADNWQASKQ